MADRLVVSSDSEDGDLEEMLARTRKRKNVRPRVDNLHEWNDEEFLTRFRLAKPTVLQLLDEINYLLETPTDRNDSLSPICQLLLTLRYYASGNFQISVGDFCGVHKSTASRTIHRVSAAIAGLRPRYVRFPSTPEERSTIQNDFFQIAGFPRVVGAIDCTHVKIQSPGGDQAEDYRNRKGYFSLNVQTVCDAKLRILDIVARWPGATHDLTVYNNSVIKARFQRQEMGNSVLVGDSGYTPTNYTITPLRNPVLPQEILFNESQIRTRNVVERKYGVWKRRFPVLAMGIRVRVDRVQAIVVACAVLHNLAIQMGEGEPPADPMLQDQIGIAIIEGQIPQIPGENHLHELNNEPVRDEFIRYFQNLL